MDEKGIHSQRGQVTSHNSSTYTRYIVGQHYQTKNGHVRAGGADGRCGMERNGMVGMGWDEGKGGSEVGGRGGVKLFRKQQA